MSKLETELHRVNAGKTYPCVGYVYIHRETCMHTGRIKQRLFKIISEGGGCTTLASGHGNRLLKRVKQIA